MADFDISVRFNYFRLICTMVGIPQPRVYSRRHHIAITSCRQIETIERKTCEHP